MPICIPETYSMYVAFNIDTDKFWVSEEKKKEFNKRFMELLNDDSIPESKLWDFFDEIDTYVDTLWK